MYSKFNYFEVKSMKNLLIQKFNQLEVELFEILFDKILMFTFFI